MGESAFQQFSNQSIGKFKRIVLPTIMRIDLEHVRHPQILERSMQARDVLSVPGCDNRLSKGSLKQPAFLHPRWFKVRANALKMGEKLVEYFVLTHFEQRIIHRTIVAEVDKVSPSILGRWAEVGMFT